MLTIDKNYLTHCILAKFAFSTLCDLFSLMKGISRNDFSKRKMKNDFLNRFKNHVGKYDKISEFVALDIIPLSGS